MGEDVQKILNNRFEVGELLGEGSFGTIHLGNDLESQKKKVAIKIQRRLITHSSRINSTTALEYEVLKLLQEKCPNSGFPEVYFFQQKSERDDDEYFVMELCGPSLWDLFVKCNLSFTLKTTLMIADQLILRVSRLHEQGYLHLDLKPGNILMGIDDKKDTLYLTDFGLAFNYQEFIKKEEAESNTKEKGVFAGTITFSSIAAMKRGQLSPRDDMESVAYVLASLLSGGELPWFNLVAENDDQWFDKVLEMKMATSPEQLFAGLPFEFPQYLKLVQQLGMKDTPNYQAYRQMFRNLGYCCRYSYDCQFDWKVRGIWGDE